MGGASQDTAHTAQTDGQEGPRREDCVTWRVAQTELGRGVGSLLNPSLEIKEKAGGQISGGGLRLGPGLWGGRGD